MPDFNVTLETKVKFHVLVEAPNAVAAAAEALQDHKDGTPK
jgi:hypothetical protein